jgi:hypothetical protein
MLFPGAGLHARYACERAERVLLCMLLLLKVVCAARGRGHVEPGVRCCSGVLDGFAGLHLILMMRVMVG